MTHTTEGVRMPTLEELEMALEELKRNQTETEWCPDNNFDGQTLNTLQDTLTQAIAIARGESVVVPVEVIKFLRGDGMLDACCFGERPPSAKGNFWWRKYLTINAAQHRQEEGAGNE